MPHNFKQGQYVFWKSEEHGSLPCIILKIGRGDRIKVSANEGHSTWVWAKNCRLQEEPEKILYVDPVKNYPRQWEHFNREARYYPGGLYTVPSMNGSVILEALDTAELLQKLIHHSLNH